jgi:hypothetical protein
MKKPVGRSYRISPFRRLVVDLMHFGSRVPAVTVDRRMDLSRLVDARAACQDRPAWTVLFTKAFAMLGRDHPLLRCSYLEFPWPRIYEHPHSIAAVNVERRLPEEDIVIFCLIRQPENRSLQDIQHIVRQHKQEPVESLRSYRRALAVSRIPWPMRRWFWWLALNLFGRRRCHNFGTFSVSSVASHGAGILKGLPVLTSTLHYGLFDQGWLDMRLTVDHRVIDGAASARILNDLESVLNREIVLELRPVVRLVA